MEDTDQLNHNTWYLKTIEDNSMIRGDDPVTLVKEKHETEFPKCYMVAQPHELTRLRALVEPVTQRRQDTGPWSGSVTAVAPLVNDDKDRSQMTPSHH